MVFDKQFFAKHQLKLLWIVNHRWLRWILGLNRLPENVKETGFTGKIDKIAPASIHWKTGKLIKKKTYRKGFRPQEVLVEEWKMLAFTRPRFAEALAYNLSPFCYFADFRRGKMVWRFSPVGVLGLLATIFLPKYFGGIALFGTTTTNYYSNPGTGATTVDGVIQRGGVTENWATIRGASSGTAAYPSLANGNMVDISDNLSLWTGFNRGIFLFDTSSIPDTSVVNSAKLYLYTTAKLNAHSSSITLCSSSPASNNNLVIGDYNISIFGLSRYATDLTISSLITSSYNYFTLNSAGIASISLTGITKLGVLISADFDNLEPSKVNGSSSVGIDFSDQTGTATDPYLEVNYTTVYTLTCTESVSLTDSVLKTIFRQFPEALNLTDTVAKTKIYLKELAESVSLTDSVLKTIFKVFTEIVSLTDALSKLQSKVISETITLSDTIIKTIYKTFSETLSLTDTIRLLKNGLNVLWGKVARPLSGGWTKQNRATDNKWNKQARP